VRGDMGTADCYDGGDGDRERLVTVTRGRFRCHHALVLPHGSGSGRHSAPPLHCLALPLDLDFMSKS
jgi:hypothetical protein